MYDIQTNLGRNSVYVIGVVFCLFAFSCRQQKEKDDEIDKWQQKLDVMANAQLDSIYKKQSIACDSLQKIRVPQIVDSLIKDSGYVNARKALNK